MKSASGIVRLNSATTLTNPVNIALDCYEASRVCVLFDYQGKSATSTPSFAVKWIFTNGVTGIGPFRNAAAITPEVYTFPAPGNNVHQIYVLEFVCPPAALQMVATITEVGDAGNPGVIIVDGSTAGIA